MSGKQKLRCAQRAEKDLAVGLKAFSQLEKPEKQEHLEAGSRGGEALQPVARRIRRSTLFEPYAYVIRTWSGGIADTKRNRLILWGGHNDYYGNELYALDLNALELI